METMKVVDALNSENVSYRNFYYSLQDADMGFWDNINSTSIIKDYINEMMREGISVSHILEAIEIEDSEYDDWVIWLGNSMETPSPINSKQDLVDALGLGKEELEIEIKIVD